MSMLEDFEGLRCARPNCGGEAKIESDNREVWARCEYCTNEQLLAADHRDFIGDMYQYIQGIADFLDEEQVHDDLEELLMPLCELYESVYGDIWL